MENDTKNTATVDNDERSSKDLTWDDADFTWDEASGTWINPYGIQNDDKNTGSMTNDTKS